MHGEDTIRDLYVSVSSCQDPWEFIKGRPFPCDYLRRQGVGCSGLALWSVLWANPKGGPPESSPVHEDDLHNTLVVGRKKSDGDLVLRPYTSHYVDTMRAGIWGSSSVRWDPTSVSHPTDLPDPSGDPSYPEHFDTKEARD